MKYRGTFGLVLVYFFFCSSLIVFFGILLASNLIVWSGFVHVSEVRFILIKLDDDKTILHSLPLHELPTTLAIASYPYSLKTNPVLPKV